MPAITLRELAGYESATIETLLPLFQRVTVHNQRLQPLPDGEVLRGVIEPRTTSDRRTIVAFDESGTPMGYALVTRNLLENSSVAKLELHIAPDRYGQGIGTALFDAAKDLARKMTCDRLAGNFVVAPGEVAAFAEKRGGKLAFQEQRTVLDLRAIDLGRYREWAAPSAPQAGRPGNADLKSVTWTNHTPDDLVQAHLVARQAMNDEPTGDVIAVKKKNMTPTELRQLEDARIAYGQRRHAVAALAPNGDMAGFTQVAVFANSTSPLAPMGNTAIARGYRGRGLALRLKAELALLMLEREPHIDLIDCFNNTRNQAMQHINKLLGWEVVSTTSVYAFRL
jgi:GNAT superfamily N-acetyltransferase/RimJ/RimL family protein N-acetyltransferase